MSVAIRERVDELQDENTYLCEELTEYNEAIAQLPSRLKRYENAHTPPSKRRSSSGNNDRSGEDDADDETSSLSPLITNGGGYAVGEYYHSQPTMISGLAVSPK